MSQQRIPIDVLEFAASVAKAIQALPDAEYTPYVTQVGFGLEGEDIDLWLRPNDFGGYDVVVGKEETE